MNKCIIIGRLTKEPEIRYTAEKKPVAKYTLAVDRNKEETDFINCVCFSKSAEFAQKYLNKGMKILAEGRIHTDSYTNKEGKKVFTTDIIVDRHEFVESKKEVKDDFMVVTEGEEDYLPFA